MEDYERHWVTERGLPPQTHLRVGLTTRDGRPMRFLVQLEYRDAEEWLMVARAEHDVDGPTYRNVERAGIHVDPLKPDGSQFAKLSGFPPEPASDAMGRAEDFLRRHADNYTTRFVQWL